MKRWLLFAVALTTLIAAAQGRPAYTVRLFWQSVPPALELAPPLPFSPATAPKLTLADGREIYLRGALRIAADGDRLALGGKYRDYAASLTSKSPLRLRVEGGAWGELRGDLRVWVAEGQIEAELRVDREEYTCAVLAGEGGGLREPEALKALAVSIRSYAFTGAGRHKAEGFDFCDTTHCQDLRLAAHDASVDAAVDETADELLWKDGAPVTAYHHADSGGQTEDARTMWSDAPAWMTGRADPYSAQPEAKRWRSTIAKQRLLQALRSEGIGLASVDDLTIAGRSRTGRVALLHAGGREIAASAFRFAVGRQLGWEQLPSDLYEITSEGATFRFDGKGRGHGVGLSQRGAAAMAKAGKAYREILAFYFPGARVGVNAQDIDWRLLRSEHLRFLFAPGSEDATFPMLAERELRRLEAETGFHLRHDVTIRIYPSIDLYRNYSGLEGGVAGGTRGSEIHLQPLALLRARGNLPATLRHELLHALVAQEAARRLPEWFEEGLALWLSGDAGRSAAAPCLAASSTNALEEGMDATSESARRAARNTATRLVALAAQHYGRETVLGWVRQFPPEDDDRLARLLQQACQGR